MRTTFDRMAPWLAWAVVALCVVLGVAGTIVTAVADAPMPLGFLVPATLLYTACTVLGAVVVTHEPRNVVGWVLVSFAVLPAALLPLNVYAGQGTDPGESQLPGAVAAEVVQSALGGAASFLPFILLLHVFPTGRTLGGWWRVVAWVSVVVMLVGSISDAFIRPDMEYSDGPNPVDWLPEIPFQVLQGLAILGIPLALAAAVVRFRRSRGVERQQLAWVAYAGALTAVTVVVAVLVNQVAGSDSPPGEVTWAVSAIAFATLPVALAIAITRHRLYDIDLVVNRTLVYGALTAIVLALYGGVVWAAGQLVSGAGSTAAVLAAAVVAVLAAPLRARLQRAVDRLLYGQRREPLAALAALGDRLAATLASDAVLPALSAAVADALRAPAVAVELLEGEEWVVEAVHGRPRGMPAHVPLTFQGETVGRLAISPAAAGEELDERGRRLVEQLARQAGPAVYGVRLTRELQRSREAIVTAREEERRRIRRDLHDGLGPQLAGIALQLSAAANGADDPAVAALARDIEEQTQAAIADVRRLVENLRPPQLDEFGLAGAIQSQAERFRDELEVSVETPAPLRALPAAVEVAAYRIATEALTNAARHAGARRCAIALRLDGALEVEVRDDGRGLAPVHRVGIGLVSMRERAAELGGTCVIEPVPGGGTRILATLPVPDGAAA